MRPPMRTFDPTDPSIVREPNSGYIEGNPVHGTYGVKPRQLDALPDVEREALAAAVRAVVAFGGAPGTVLGSRIAND